MDRNRIPVSNCLILPALAAMVCGCSRMGFDAGTVQLCLVGEPTAPGKVGIRASGIVTALDVGTSAPAECYIDGAATLLTVTEPDGTGSTVAIAVRDGRGGDATPALDVELSDPVSLLFRRRIVWEEVSGMVLDDSEGLVAAFEEGTSGSALEAADVNGLAVRSTEEDAGEQHHACGVRFSHALEFLADEAVSIRPVHSAAITIDGEPYTALAVADYSWDKAVRCTDLTGATSWAVVRQGRLPADDRGSSRKR